MPDIIALDIAILPPDEVVQRCLEENRKLWEQGHKGFRFDETHLPHCTIVQQFTPRVVLDRMFGALDQLLRDFKALVLTVSQMKIGESDAGDVFSWYAIERSPAIYALHIRIATDMQPFTVDTDGSIDAFYPGFDEFAVRTHERYIRRFRERESSTNYKPHITLGAGRAAPLKQPFTFTASRVAVCQLGEFWTCRKILREWTLPSNS